MMTEVDEHLENEWYVVRHSGEIPEIALHSSLHYLAEAEDGPRLTLNGQQQQMLMQAAAERFKEIVLRDMVHENRSLPVYRGLKRSIINYRRYRRFCHRQDMDGTVFDQEFGSALVEFLGQQRLEAVREGTASTINCTFEELLCFAVELGLSPESLPEGIEPLCRLRN